MFGQANGAWLRSAEGEQGYLVALSHLGAWQPTEKSIQATREDAVDISPQVSAEPGGVVSFPVLALVPTPRLGTVWGCRPGVWMHQGAHRWSTGVCRPGRESFRGGMWSSRGGDVEQ